MRVVNIKPERPQRVIAALIPILLILFVYGALATARAESNPGDKILPTFLAMADAALRLATEVDPRTGQVTALSDTLASLWRLGIGVGIATVSALLFGLALGVVPYVRATFGPLIAVRIGLSQAPCWRRIQRLRQEGYIRAEVALLDRRKLGFNTQIFAQIKLTATGRQHVEDFTTAIREFPEVLDCFVLMGSVDFLLRIVARDIEAYERFFFEKLSLVPGVQEINSIVALSEIKSTTALPIDQTG